MAYQGGSGIVFPPISLPANQTFFDADCRCNRKNRQGTKPERSSGTLQFFRPVLALCSKSQVAFEAVPHERRGFRELSGSRNV